MVEAVLLVAHPAAHSSKTNSKCALAGVGDGRRPVELGSSSQYHTAAMSVES